MRKKRKKIAVVIGSRANYSSIKSVMEEIRNSPNLELLIFVGASALLERYGRMVNLIEKDGFKITEKFYILVEGENPQTMAMSAGLGIIELSGLFMNHKPDLVITVGDRFETIATAVAASYMNIHIVHTMGGEVSGTIDESIRHAVTKFSHIHFPANKKAAERIIKMGEDKKYVFPVGCPRVDLVKDILSKKRSFSEKEFWKKHKGVGGNFRFLEEKFLLVSQHPVTTEYGDNRKNMHETLMALKDLNMPTIMLWPNADAGSDETSKEIRSFREKFKPDSWLHVFTNLPTEVYIHLMDKCSCLIGNSSSAIREGAIIGVPAVNIGSRQQGRSRGKNVKNVKYNKKQIVDAIKKQINHGKYKPDFIYGDGSAGKRIVAILKKLNLSKVPVQKRIRY